MLNYTVGATFKRDLLAVLVDQEVFPESISIKPRHLRDLQSDPRYFLVSLALQDYINSTRSAVPKGGELCVEAPGLVTFTDGPTARVSEILANSGIMGTVLKAEVTRYFTKGETTETAPGVWQSEPPQLWWGPVLTLTDPKYFDLSGSGRERLGDSVRMPVLPNELPWSQVTQASI